MDAKSFLGRQVVGEKLKQRTRAVPRHETPHEVPEAPKNQAKEIQEVVVQVQTEIADQAQTGKVAQVHETDGNMANQYHKGQDG